MNTYDIHGITHKTICLLLGETHALRAAAAEEDQDHGEQPQRVHQVCNLYLYLCLYLYLYLYLCL